VFAGFQCMPSDSPIAGKPVINACPGESKRFNHFFGAI
jgi:hypothetical protein